MTFRAKCWFGVVARGGRGLFSRERIFPFFLSPGMCVSFDDDPGKWEITRVSRVARSGTSSCHLGDFEEPNRDWAEVRDDYLARGWVLVREWIDHARTVRPFWLGDCRGAG